MYIDKQILNQNYLIIFVRVGVQHSEESEQNYPSSIWMLMEHWYKVHVYLQGFKDHKLYDPLEMPGSADLTADVDFAYLKHCCGENGTITAIQLSTWTIVFYSTQGLF